MWKLKKSTTKSRYKVGDVVMFTEPSFTIHGNSKEFTVVRVCKDYAWLNIWGEEEDAIDDDWVIIVTPLSRALL